MAGRQLEAIQAATITAGIHTIEINSPDRAETLNNNRAWSYSKGGRIRINPHKFTTIADKYKCLYGNRTETENAIQSIISGLNLHTWQYSRIDYAFDFSCAYSETSKIIHLLLLMIAEYMQFDNNYFSNDPVTNELKTMRIGISDYEGKQGDYEAEHYNRQLIEQSRYDTVIRNRLELRTTGVYLDDPLQNRTLVYCLEKWLAIMNHALTEDILNAVEARQAGNMFSEWQR